MRARTAELHARVEAAMPVMDPGLTLDDYARLLTRLLAFYDAAERSLGRWAPELRALGLDLDERRKLPMLRRDLQALAARVPLPGQEALDPALHPRPLAPTFPRALGTLYVLEGATLGGQIIRRRLRETLGVDVDSGGAFFASYGARVGPLWSELRAVVDDWGAVHAGRVDREECVAGACDAFAAFVYVPAPAPARSVA